MKLCLTFLMVAIAYQAMAMPPTLIGEDPDIQACSDVSPFEKSFAFQKELRDLLSFDKFFLLFLSMSTNFHQSSLLSYA